MKRQGLKISIKQLIQLTNELCEELNSDSSIDQCFQINIINKEGLSDTWEIEE